MFSAKIPFESVQLYNLPLLLKRGERPSLPADDLSQHHSLSAEVDLIQDCWTQDPTKQPSADRVVERLNLLPNQSVNRHAVNEIETSFSMQLSSNQVNNPFAFFRQEYHWSGL